MPLSYLQWNDLLAQHYFNEDKTGQDVIIYANAELIDKLGSQVGSDFFDFKEKIIEGPDWVQNRVGFCNKAYYSFNGWRRRTKLSFPPYIAYLVFLVHVATVNGEFDSNAYYPRLRSELGEEPVSGTYPHFDKIDALWADLQRWTEEDKEESLGRFTLRRRFEAWKHVGIPLSQILLSDEEREELPLFFFRAGLDPSDLPSDDTILQNLKMIGPSIFQRRTIKMIQGQKKEHLEFQNALVDLVISSLSEWDGMYEDVSENRLVSNGKSEAPSSAILGFKIDMLSGNAVFDLRVKSKKEFPDIPLFFKVNNRTLSCRGSGSPSWSTPLKEERDGNFKNFNPVHFDWTTSVLLKSDENWSLRFKGSKVRVFLSGQAEGLPGWIEVQRVKVKTEYYILCHDSLRDEIKEWGPKSNREFQEKRISGIPQGWSAFHAKDLNESHPDIGILSLPRQSRIFLEGGLRLGRSNHFLMIVPPSIILDSKTGDDEIYINGISTPIKSTKDDPTKFVLPQDLPLNVPIIIELKDCTGTILQKRTLFLERFINPVCSQEVIARDPSGEIVPHEELHSWLMPNTERTLASGAIVKSLKEINSFIEPETD